jgi:hypothetical protein
MDPAFKARRNSGKRTVMPPIGEAAKNLPRENFPGVPIVVERMSCLFVAVGDYEHRILILPKTRL